MATTWKTVRVFISSTFLDMQAERDYLVRFVFPRVREQLLKRRIHFVDVDLRWGVTSERDALDVCREVVDECHPWFLCMLGGRYGEIKPDRELSGTHLEVNYGVLDRRGERDYAFFYFRDPRATAEMVEEIPGVYREPPGSAKEAKLERLKTAIEQGGFHPFVYQAKWDAEQRRLTGLEEFGERVFEDILRRASTMPDLADRFVEGSASEIDPFAEENAAMEEFIEELVDRYVIGSRQKLLDELLSFAQSDGVPNFLVLRGNSGSGKTALLGKFCRTLQNASRFQECIVIPHFIGATAGSTDLRRTLRRICRELAIAAGITDPIPENIKELVEQFPEFVRKAANTRRVVLILDGLNQLDPTDNAHAMHWLPQRFPRNVRIVISSLEHAVLETLRRRGDRVRMANIEPLTRDDSLAIIEAFLQRYRKRLSAEQIEELLSKPESGVPLYLLAALEELRTLGTYDEITGRIRELPGDARSLFEWILKERLSSDPGFRDRGGHSIGGPLVEKFVSYLGVSRHGLSSAELTGLIDPLDPIGNVSALQRLLRPYLMWRGELFDFYHRQIREVVESTYISRTEQRVAAHRALAEYFRQKADPTDDGAWAGQDVRGLSELPYHQRCGELWAPLESTLCNLRFIEARCSAGTTPELVSDYHGALGTATLPAVHRNAVEQFSVFVRSQSHVLSRCPWLTFQQASNQADETLPAQMARKHLPAGPWLRRINKPIGSVTSLATLWGHRTSVVACAFSPDGTRIVSGAEDGEIKVWDAESGAQELTLKGHTAGIRCCVFSPDGTRIVSGSDDKTLKLWDAAGGEEILTFRGHKAGVQACAFTKDGLHVISTGRDKTVREWDVGTGKQVISGLGRLRQWWMRRRDTVLYVSGFFKVVIVLVTLLGVWWAFRNGFESPIGFALAIGFALGGIFSVLLLLYFSTFVGAPIGVWKKHRESDEATVISADGCAAACWTKDGSVRLRSPQGRFMERFTPNRARRRSRMIRWLVLLGVDSFIAPFFDGWRFARRVYASAISPDGSRIIAADAAGKMILFDLVARQEVAAFGGQTGQVLACTFSPDGTRIVTASQDQTVRAWDAQTGAHLGIIGEHGGAVAICAFSPDGMCVVAGSTDSVIKVWSQETEMHASHSLAIADCKFSPRSGELASASLDGRVNIWTSDSGATVRSFASNSAAVSACDWFPDGKRILSASADCTLRIWDAATGRQLRELSPPAGPFLRKLVAYAAAIPQFRREFPFLQQQIPHFFERIPYVNRWLLIWAIVVAAFGYVLPFGDTPLSRELFQLHQRHGLVVNAWTAVVLCVLFVITYWIVRSEGAVVACGFSPNGRRLIAAMKDGTVKVWDAASGVRLWQRVTPWSHITSCILSPDGSRLVLTSEDRTLRLWDVSTGTLMATMRGHTGSVTSCSFSPDGSRVLSSSSDRTLRLWDTTNGLLIATFQPFNAPATVCAFSLDGRYCVSGHWDGTLAIWNTDTGELTGSVQTGIGAIAGCAFSPDGTWLLSQSRSGILVLLSLGNAATVSYFADGAITAAAWRRDGAVLAVGDNSGKIHILQLEGIVAGPPIVTAWQRPSEKEVVFGCPACRLWMQTAAESLGTVKQCEECGSYVMLNPFTIHADWHPVAEAWRS